MNIKGNIKMFGGASLSILIIILCALYYLKNRKNYT